MNRIEAAASAGTGTMVVGKVGDEIAKAPEMINLIDIDVFGGSLAPYGLTVGGTILILGFSLTASMFIINWIRTNKDDEWLDDMVKKPKRKKWFKREKK